MEESAPQVPEPPIKEIEIPQPEPERPVTSRKHFTQTEDAYILKWVELNGTQSWHGLASQLPDRSVRQIRDRYRYYLSADYPKKEWTKQEDEILISLVITCGNKWSQFAKLFPGRSDCDLKNHWQKIKRIATRA